jgi:hypothetical protein
VHLSQHHVHRAYACDLLSARTCLAVFTLLSYRSTTASSLARRVPRTLARRPLVRNSQLRAPLRSVSLRSDRDRLT